MLHPFFLLPFSHLSLSILFIIHSLLHSSIFILFSSASWQKEWRSPKLHPALCPAPSTSAEHINQQPVQGLENMCHPASIGSSPPAQTTLQMFSPLHDFSPSHVQSPHPMLQSSPPVLPQPMISFTVTPKPGVSSLIVASTSERLSPESASISKSQSAAIPTFASLSPHPASLVSTSNAPATSLSSPSTSYPCVSSLSSSVHLTVSDAPLSSSLDVGPVVTPPVFSESGREQSVLDYNSKAISMC